MAPTFPTRRSSDLMDVGRIGRADLDRQVEGRDDGEISLAAETFARESAYVFPDGMNSVGVGKADRHHDEQILLPFEGLFFILLAQALRVEAVVVRHRWRSEEHTSELQSLMRISYAVFCLKNKTNINGSISP